MTGTRASSLCAECALCCTGWIFFETRLTPADARSFGKRITVIGSAAGPLMCQPCSLLRDRSCTVYESRPSPCSTYACASLTAVERGKLKFDEARERLAHARAAMDVLGDALRETGWMEPGDAGVTAWRKFTRAARHAVDPVTFNRTHAAVLLAGAAAVAAGELALGECL